MSLYPPPVLHLVLLGGPNDLFKALRMKYFVAFSAFQRKFGYDLRTWPGVPDNVREAVVDYLKATWKVYLVSMKKEVDGDYEQVFRTFREKFELVRKLLKVSHTVKIHCVSYHLAEYIKNCQTTFAWTSDEFIESIHGKLRKFQEIHSWANKKKGKFGSPRHQKRLLSTIELYNYQNLGDFVL